MAKFSYIGTIDSIDHIEGKLVINLDYIVPEDLYLLEDLCVKKESHKFTHNKAKEGNLSYKLQKAWYGSLAEILRVQKIVANSEYMKYFDEEMRKSIFPVKEIVIDDKTIFVPRRLKELNNDERYSAVMTLQERYDFVDWLKIREGMK